MSAKRLIKKAVKAFVAILLTLVLLLAAAIFVGTVFKNERGMSPWGTGFYFIISGSMEPTLPVGSLVFVTEVSANAIEENDIVTYLSSDGSVFVTHRVREVVVVGGAHVYTTRGDANNIDDPPLQYERLVGRVLFSVPGSSFLLKIFSEMKYPAIAVILIGVIICARAVWNSSRKKRKEVAEEEQIRGKTETQMLEQEKQDSESVE
jgi:signal peptidase